MPPVTIVFGFPASEGRVENLPEKVPTSLRGIPPRRQSQYAIAPTATGYCGSVKPVYAKDEDIEDLLFLSTDLFDDLDLAKRAVGPGGELAEVYERCANAAFYAIDLPASATRTASLAVWLMTRSIITARPQSPAARVKPLRSRCGSSLSPASRGCRR